MKKGALRLLLSYIIIFKGFRKRYAPEREAAIAGRGEIVTEHGLRGTVPLYLHYTS